MKRFLFLIGIVGFFASCGKSTKSNQENEPDSLLNVRAAVVSQRLPHEEGSLTMVKCEYDGKTVNISLKVKEGCDELMDREMLKWLPAMKLNDIHTLDTLMIKRLVELNQPLTYSVYSSKDSLINKFSLSAAKLKGRAGSYGMLK